MDDDERVCAGRGTGKFFDRAWHKPQGPSPSPNTTRQRAASQFPPHTNRAESDVGQLHRPARAPPRSAQRTAGVTGAACQSMRPGRATSSRAQHSPQGYGPARVAQHALLARQPSALPARIQSSARRSSRSIGRASSAARRLQRVQSRARARCGLFEAVSAPASGPLSPDGGDRRRAAKRNKACPPPSLLLLPCSRRASPGQSVAQPSQSSCRLRSEPNAFRHALGAVRPVVPQPSPPLATNSNGPLRRSLGFGGLPALSPSDLCPIFPRENSCRATPPATMTLVSHSSATRK